MTAHTNSESERAIALDDRETQLRKMMYSTPGLLERLDAGRDAAERGEWVTLREVDERLAKRG